MGTVTDKITRYWSKGEINFIKRNWRLSSVELSKVMKRDMHGIVDKRRALNLPKRECDIVPITFKQKMILYGSLLGDGSIVSGKEDRNCRFSEAHSVKQKDYLLFKHKQLEPFSGKFIEYPRKDGGRDVKFSTKAHSCFNKLRMMFYDKSGRKIIKFSTLKKITHPIALAMWFGDDGSKEKDSYRIATAAYTVQEIKTLIKWLKDFFNINGYLHKHGKYWYLSIREDRTRFTKLIKSYLPKGLYYKLFLMN